MNESGDSEKPADSQNASPAYDIETYRHALEEARRTLNQQLEAFNDVADKAWRIVQFNGIIATVYVAAVANALDDLTYTWMSVILVALGLVLMGSSVYLAAEGQQAQTVPIGQSSDAFASIRKHDPDEITYLYKTLADYEDWIDQVHEKTEANGETVNWSKRLLIIGVVFITGGTIVAIVL